MLQKKTGVLIVNLGTPESPERSDVYRYLSQFLMDPRVIDYPWLLRTLLVRGIIVPIRSGSSSRLYKKLWTPQGSPIKFYGESLVQKVRTLLPESYEVELAMRYQSPSIESALNKLMEKLVDEIIVFPLFPHYASATTGSVHDEVMRLLRGKTWIPELKLINSYPTRAGMIEVFAENASKYDLDEYDHILFSYHGLPERQLKNGDQSGIHCLKVKDCCKISCKENAYCYSAQGHRTSEAIAELLGIQKEKYTVCFQSRLGPESWSKPYTSQVIKQRLEMGDKKLLVFSPAFVADCLETTIEIGFEYKEEFIEAGGERLDLVESLNVHPKWIQTVADMILERSQSPVSQLVSVST